MHQRTAVLLVDDEKFNLALLAGMFDRAQFEVVRAYDGTEALGKLQAMPKCDLILLDRHMPLMDGMEVLRTLKSDPRFCGIPVIMQTAAAEATQIEQGMAAGACAYVVKPYDEDTIWTAVQNALSPGGGEPRTNAAGA